MSLRVSLLPDDAVAVVGAACRLPGGINHLDDLWAVLATGRDVVGAIPPDRFPADDFVDTDRRRSGMSYTAAGGFLGDITGFDASFFTGISPREAARMDPQQRLLLEMAVEALDDAGMHAARLEGSDTAVFMGCSSRDYGELQSCSPETGNAYTMSGMAGAIVANRLSHYFDWHGQSVTVDTACSSALTALHQACEHLRSGHSRLAVAGGINVLINPQGFTGFSGASMLSPTGRCRPFSAQADGFVRSEGGGLVMLKRLGDARADGDRVHGVILASGTNNDGRTPGLALPSSTAQHALLSDIYHRAGLVPDDVAYLEAHGTGTQAGDPLECEAISRALGVGRSRGALPIGSVKSNIGHLEAASGMAGLFKALLVLRHRQIPPTLHADELNPAIDFEGWNVRPVTRTEPLDHAGLPLAGVNSFGFGGANAHVVLAASSLDSPSTAQAAPPGTLHGTKPHLPVAVSARTGQALRAAAEQMAQHLQFTDEGDFYDAAWTSAVRRGRHEYGAAVLADSPQQAAEALFAFAAGDDDGPAVAAPRPVAGRPGKVAYVFSGNGAQWAGMGLDLLESQPVFAAAVKAVDAELLPRLGWSVCEQLAAGSPRVAQTEVAQPLLFAMQIGVVRLLESYGIEPDAVVGHSVGEIAAAHVSGALDLAQACQVVAVRSQAQATTAGTGRMAAIGLGAKDAAKELAAYHGRLELAGVNSHSDVTVAGDPKSLAELGRQLGARDVFFRELDLDYAFHSRAMDSIQYQVTDALTGLRPGTGRIPMGSTVTGGLLNGARLDGEYWWRNVREPVLFADAVRALADDGCQLFVEIAPHAILTPYLRRLLKPGQTIPTLRRDQDGPLTVRRAATSALAAGANPRRLFARPGRVVTLPSYPWQRERHWNGTADWWTTVPQDKTLVHRLLGRRAPVAEPAWHQQISTSRLPWLSDHQVDGAIVMPATAYVEAALAAGRHTFTAPCEVTDLNIVRPLTLPSRDNPTTLVMQTSLSQEDGIVHIASRTDPAAEWTLHARARVRRLLAPAPQTTVAADLTACPGIDIDPAIHYEHTARAGLAYGPAFQVLTALRLSDTDVHADYELPPTTSVDAFEAHPVILDGAMQAVAPLLAYTAGDRMFLPTAIDTVRVWQQPTPQGRLWVRLRDLTDTDAVLDVTVTAQDGTITAELSGCRLHAVAGTRSDLQELATELRAAPSPSFPSQPPVPLPDPTETVAATATERSLVETGQADNYADFAPLVKTAVGHWAAAAFKALLPGRTEFGLDELLAAQVPPHYAAYSRLLARMAVRAGLLHEATGGDRWQFSHVPIDPHLHTQACVDLAPHWITAIALYTRCGTHLTDILSGRTDPRELLFTEADRHLFEAFYADTPQLRAHTAYARCLLSQALANWPADRPLRVLEVGAGTGSLTAALLPVLPTHLTRYTYTDVSAAFFPRARPRFANYDFLDYRTLDLNRDPGEQGFALGGFDLIVASNVLHATRDLHTTLTGIASLLDEAGQLIAIESHDEEILGPCFGLLEEYWSFTDPHLRTSPLLPRDAWAPLLKDCGFDTVADTASRDPEAAEDYSLMLARRSPGARTPELSHTLDGPSVEQSVIPVSCTVVTDEKHSDLAEALAHALASASSGRPEIITVRQQDDPWSDRFDALTLGNRIVLLLPELTTSDEPDTITRAAGLLKALAAAGTRTGRDGSELWLVTGPTGLHPAPETEGQPAAAALWGVGRVIANEHPALKVRRISLHSAEAPHAQAARLAAELLAPGQDDEIVLGHKGRFVPRQHPLTAAHRPAQSGDHQRLELRRPGRNRELTWIPAPEQPPAPGQIVLRVRAAALNYRDIMLAEGMLPAGAEPPTATGPRLGLECAGDIVSIGDGVNGLKAGDRVFAFGHGTLTSHVHVRTEQTGPIPDDMTYDQATTLPAVYLTVQHSLETLARLAPGETLLVHGGAGGIGLAALRYAQHIGAHVIATAGSPAKRDLLRMLGATHVLNSRDLGFAHEVHELTEARGVDVVLNSLAGEGIARSLECLRPGGRFVELGKRDIYSNAPMLLRPFRNNLAYFAVDITRLIADTPQDAAAAFRTVTQRVTDGTYRPLPHQSYPAARVDDAMSTLRHSRHLGKVVISFADHTPVSVEQPDTPPQLNPDATYLISGGLSGLGAATARHLAARGARHLVLLGRRGAASPEATGLLEDLHGAGARATAHGLDITDHNAVRAVFDQADAEGRPVRGVIHAAMHLDDAPLEELTRERFLAVLAPKTIGATVLDQLTRDRTLDFFVVYSSVAGLIGNLHQAPYAAANLHLEALVRTRREHGLPGTAMAWGGIADTGYVARTQLADNIARSGIGLITPATALKALDRHLHRGAISTTVGVMDWQRLTHILPALTAPRFTAQLQNTDGRPNRTAANDLRRRLKAADSDQARLEIITESLTDIAAHILQTTPDRIDPAANLANLGLDSLMGAELKVLLQQTFGCELPLMELMAAGTVNGLAHRLQHILHPTAPQ